MKFVSLKITLITCVCIFELISRVNSEENELEKIKEVFSKRLLKEIGLHLLKTNRTDTKCISDIRFWYKELRSQKSLWPFQMLDSWGKIPSGIATFNFNSLGQFDECINIEHLHIKGKYCLAEFDIVSTIRSFSQYSNETNNGFDIFGMVDTLSKGVSISYKSGVCFPSSCKSADIENLLKMIFNVFNVKPVFKINTDNCSTNDPVKWRSIDWVAFSIFMFIFLLVILSTTYDLLARFWKEKGNGRSHKLMISFSMWNNGKQIISVNNSSKNIKCLSGLRSITVFWVILIHRIELYRFIPLTNVSDILKMIERNVACIILGSHFGVDTFFVLSGFLLTYTTFNRLKKGETFNILSFYRNRLVRLTPVLAAILLFYVSLFVHMGDGPLWKSFFMKTEISNCEKYWWSTLLYVNNYYNIMEMCLGHTWYLSSDMQLYILSPILIYSIMRWKKVGWIHTTFWILIAQIFKYVIAYQKNFKAAVFPVDEDKMKFFYQTGTRVTPWLIGFLFGYFLHLKSGSKLKINKVVVAILWLSSLTIMGTLVFSSVHLQKFDRVVTHAEDTTYLAFSKTVWALCVCWIITACAHGYGGLINWLLSLRIWEIMARFSFCIYLVHLLIMHVMTGPVRNAVFLSYLEMYKSYLNDVFVSMVVGYFLTILIELPFRNIDSVMFPRSKIRILLIKKINNRLSTPGVTEKSIKN